MSVDYIPQNNPEREAVIQSIVSYLGSPTANPTFVAIESAVFATPRASYTAARERYDAALAAARSTSSVAESADGDFERDLRLFTSSIRDSAGRSAPRVVSDLLGGISASELVGRTWREKVQRVSALLRRLGDRVGLSYDLSRADALRLSTAALELATGDDDAADRELRVSGAALTAARDSFDRSYRALIRAARTMLEESTLMGIFPSFVRANPSDEPTEELPVVTPDTPSEDPVG